MANNEAVREFTTIFPYAKPVFWGTVAAWIVPLGVFGKILWINKEQLWQFLLVLVLFFLCCGTALVVEYKGLSKRRKISFTGRGVSIDDHFVQTDEIDQIAMNDKSIDLVKKRGNIFDKKTKFQFVPEDQKDGLDTLRKWAMEFGVNCK